MSDMLSQEEINALLGDSVATNEDKNLNNSSEILTDENRDILGEVGNISMGTSATTLSALLNHKVEISTPTVSMVYPKDLSSKYDKPCVGLKINYKEGLIGSNLLILKQEDVKIIANLMMGGDGNVPLDEELTELDLSAISEAMNQMVGSSSTSLSSMLGYKIDIDTPQAFILKFEDDTFFEELTITDEHLVCNSFRMVVQDLIDSEIMQLLPIEFAESIIQKLTANEAEATPEPTPQPVPQPQPTQPQIPQPTPTPQPQPIPQPVQQQPMSQQSNIMHNNVNVQTAQFQSFDMNELAQQKENITIIRDVPLEVTVELGRTRKPIKEILEFNPGTVIELDKLAGEPIDILVNGKFIARGEVVVIDENFGVRITDIINTEERI
ncbi:flagellar motor switch phosphatase FliY [[Clostridium] colinum]|uniref:flagellar motor switch phosphatase FliY n=1 Tax=[Clostridium] colinum TaxID=36835 RepID=UPI002024C4CE|nr:flagellar motor switch phosphatase FliY [[Clostridium] colinum]